MKRLQLIFLLVSSVSGFGQQPQSVVLPTGIIERIDVSGIPDSRLSAELRSDVQKLVGQPYDANAVGQVAEGIQIELPEYVAAATTQPGSQPDRIRIVLVVARISDNEALKTNINSRYVVDAVEVGGSYKARISDALNADLQSMVGKNLDNKRAEELGNRIKKENDPVCDPGATDEAMVRGCMDSIIVNRKLRRSDSPQHVKIVYEVEKSKNNINFSGTDGVYHSRQGFSMPHLKFKFSHSNVPGQINFDAVNDPHELIERYAGIGFGYSVGFRPVLFEARYSSYRAQWKENTIQADAHSQSPGLYRLRDTIATSLAVSLPFHLNAVGGADFVELQMQTPTAGFQKSGVLKGSLSSAYGRKSGPAMTSHSWEWKYQARTGTNWLDSDFIYTRHELNIGYRYQKASETVFSARFIAGRITGNAPMFERFSLGNVTTLRGWNKYELDPLGGTRVVHGSAEYTYKFITGFYDIGSIWSGGLAATPRQAAGFKIGFDHCKGAKMANPLCWASVTVGFPINSGQTRPALLLGM